MWIICQMIHMKCQDIFIEKKNNKNQNVVYHKFYFAL